MESHHRLRSVPAAEPPSLHDVQRLIERLDREDRAMLRPWILARYDVRGYRAVTAIRPAEPSRRP